MKRGVWLAALGLVATGCTVERLGPDADCVRNSDCQDVLVCADARCRPQCVEDRDCARGLLCVPSGSFGLRACLPPGSPALCAVNSECPEDALCVDGQCRAECAEDLDCLDGARCHPGTATCETPLDRAPDAGPAGDGSVASCADGGFVCGAGCRDLFTDRANCGGCGVGCPTNETCVDAYCTCVDPSSICGAACIDLRTNEDHCGECGVPCDGPCNEGRCCGPRRMSCDGSCISIVDAPMNCGSCGAVCGADQTCVGTACRPSNDRCEGAQDISLSAGPLIETTGTTGGGTDSPRSCGTFPDVYFAFTLTRRELVWIEAVATNAVIGFLNGDCDTVGLRCPDSLCDRGDPTTRGDAWAVLDVGRHLFVVDAVAGTSSTAFTLRVHHVPVTDLDPEPLPAGAFVGSGALPSSGDTPGSCSPGADRAHFFATCPGETGGMLTADTCGTTAVDTVLGHVSSRAATPTCNDDGTCVPGAELTAALPPEPTLHVVYVESATGGSGGAYRLAGTRP